MQLKKKADISMSTLIMAIIAITVLVVVILIFSSNIRKPAGEFGKLSDTELDGCENIVFGRTCIDPNTETCPEGKTADNTNFKCSHETKTTCCVSK